MKPAFHNVPTVIIGHDDHGLWGLPKFKNLHYVGLLSKPSPSTPESSPLLFLHFLTNACKFSTYRGCAAVWLGNSILIARPPEWIVMPPNRLRVPGAYARIQVSFLRTSL